jgi:hypothetical protein
MRAIAAVSMLLPEKQKFVLGKPLTVYTLHTHNLGSILSLGRIMVISKLNTQYQAQLLDCLEVTVLISTCLNLNPASLLPTKGDVLSQSCEEVLSENYNP